jgi:prophage DNA circulation protein
LLLQGRELLAGRSSLLAAQRAVAEKSAAVASAKQELWEAKQAMTRQAGLLEAVAHDIFQVCGAVCCLLSAQVC